VEDLLRLIDEAHGRGIGVILDTVLNHTGHLHPFKKMYPWEESPWYGDPIGERNQFGLPTLDFTKPATNSFVRDVQAYWLRVFHIDGFRYDYLAGLGANEEGQGLPYLMRTAREIRPESYLFGECIPEDPELTKDSGLSGVWHTRSRLALECLLRQRDEVPFRWDDFEDTVRSFDPTTQGYNDASFMLNYIECHDDIRIMRSLRDEIGFSEDVAYRKSALAAIILMTIPGEPMLWQGQEWGESAVRQQKPNKIHWDLLETPEGRCLRQHYSDVAKLRRERTSIRTPNFGFLLIDSPRRLVVYHRWLGEADQVVVAANFSAEKQQMTIPFPQQGQWRERFGQQLLNVTGDLEYELDAYWAVVFTSGVS
jgi:1,4-alpha-glucan branching enzyme